jgi:hypothetical protein
MAKTAKVTTPAVNSMPAVEKDQPKTPTPTDTENLQGLSFGELVERNLGYSALHGLGLEKLMALCRDNVVLDTRLKTEQKAFKEIAQQVGKIMAAAYETYGEDQAAGRIDKGTTFVDYYYEKTDEKPSGRAEQCCVVFRKLVIPGHMEEFDYDNVAVEWLRETSTVVNLLLKGDQKMTCDIMLDCINIMHVRPKDGNAKLRAIKNKLLGKETVSKDGKGAILDAANFVAIFDRGCEMTPTLRPYALTSLIAQAKKLVANPTEDTRQFYFAVLMLGDVFGVLSKETVAAWNAEQSAKTAAPKIISEVSTASFLAWAKENYDGIDGDALTITAKSVADFFAANNRLPNGTAEFDAYMEKVSALEVAA